MSTFVKLYCKHNNAVWWSLKIENIDQLCDYHTNVVNKTVRDTMVSMSKSKEYGFGKNHCSSKIGHCLGLISEVSEKAPIDVISSFWKTLFENQQQSIKQNGYILVNKEGGYTPGIPDDWSVIETITKSDFIFPKIENEKLDIRIIKWPNGTHFYAKVNNEDVVWNGEQKWNTEEEARNAANLYIKCYMK